ncbi:unnamed protein product [Agarophyton chilense]|eukprot:gb/GEZJ01002807.1/.p1 GENE.gb/GEZJ01002807.1/~~gb/GEZJ01002807.1/.p1  ORF type:complete len:429 (-),score=114.61 gb/GEZJ01002807.1/:346-1632(-)
MDAEKVAFWGIVLKPGEPADLDLDDGETLRVTTASYGEDLSDSSGRSVITASIRPDDDSSPRKFAVAVLSAGKTETVTMDVAFVGEENVSFEVSGKNAVHLVGNFSFENDLDDEDSEDENEENHLIGLYEDTMSSESEEDAEDGKVKALPEKDKPIITELPDEDDEDDDEDEDDEVEEHPVEVKKSPVVSKKKGKKGKMANGESARPTKKVANASAEPLSKPEKKVTEDVGKNQHTASQKKSGKGKKKKSGHKHEVNTDVQPSGGSANDGGNVDMKNDGGDVDMKDDGKRSAKVPKKLKSKSAADDVKMPPKDDDDAVEIVTKGIEEENVAPSSKKDKKRRRKQSVTVNVPEQAPTPPSAKKTKISERIATPAPSRMTRQGAASERTPKPNGSADANGVQGAKDSGTKTPPTDAPSSKRRRRTRKNKA